MGPNTYALFHKGYSVHITCMWHSGDIFCTSGVLCYCSTILLVLHASCVYGTPAVNPASPECSAAVELLRWGCCIHYMCAALRRYILYLRSALLQFNNSARAAAYITCMWRSGGISCISGVLCCSSVTLLGLLHTLHVGGAPAVFASAECSGAVELLR
jgi:hypothetical protein